MSLGGLFLALVVVSVGFAILSWFSGRARRRELKRLDEREEELRRQGKID